MENATLERPRPARIRLTVYVAPHVIRALREERDKTDRPQGAIIEDALTRHLSIEVTN